MGSIQLTCTPSCLWGDACPLWPPAQGCTLHRARSNSPLIAQARIKPQLAASSSQHILGRSQVPHYGGRTGPRPSKRSLHSSLVLGDTVCAAKAGHPIEKELC